MHPVLPKPEEPSLHQTDFAQKDLSGVCLAAVSTAEPDDIFVNWNWLYYLLWLTLQQAYLVQHLPQQAVAAAWQVAAAAAAACRWLLRRNASLHVK